jgi:hypothetical protein
MSNPDGQFLPSTAGRRPSCGYLASHLTSHLTSHLAGHVPQPKKGEKKPGLIRPRSNNDKRRMARGDDAAYR